MKVLIGIIVGIILLISTNIYANDNLTKKVEFPTMYLMQWTYNCSQRIQPEYLRRGVPPPMALQFSIQYCSCVIDEFRKDWTKDGIEALSFDERSAVAEIYATNCLSRTNTL